MNTSPRPWRLTDEMKLRAAAKTAHDLVEQGQIEADEEESAARDIAKFGNRGMDGYELAKALDDRCYWNCTRDMLDALDTFSSAADDEIKEAERAWALENNIQPPFPVGSRVIARWGGQDYVGTIDEISKWGIAQYAVKADGETGTGRMVVKFEDCRACAETVPA